MDYKLSRYCICIDESENEVVLYHSVTGGIIKLEKAIYQAINGICFSSDIPYFDMLKNEHYIVPKMQDEYRLLRLRELQSKLSYHDTLSYIIAPTTSCNLNCIYCFEKNHRKGHIINIKTIDAIAEFVLSEAKKSRLVKKVRVTWFGGEPLLCYNEILSLGKKIKDELTNINIEFESNIITNGILLTREKVVKLKEYCNLLRAQITMDGLCEEYCRLKQANDNDYNKLIQNIRDNYLQIEINIRLNTNKTNLKEMYAVADMFYKEIGLGKQLNIYLAPIRDYKNCIEPLPNCFTLEEFENIKAEFYNYLLESGYIDKKSILDVEPPHYKLIYCGLARENNFVIGPDGELYKCEHHIGNDEKVVGDVINGLYYDSGYFKNSFDIQDDICKKCNLFPICQCRCMAFNSLIEKDNNSCSHYNLIYAYLKNFIGRYIGRTA